MIRELTGHKVNPANDKLVVQSLDEPGRGGAHYKYSIALEHSLHSTVYAIDFQNGPIAEVGVNGVTHEALLAILIDRLECFQNGPFRNSFNADALYTLKLAQNALHQRTKERMARNVEGTHQV